MRYTEVRLARVAALLLDDLDQDTVDFQPNYDETEEEPRVLPAVSRSSWSTVPTASRSAWRPSFRRTTPAIADAPLDLIEDPDAARTAHAIVPGPDFPTGGIIIGRSGVRSGFDRAGLYHHPRARRVRRDPPRPRSDRDQRDPLSGEQGHAAGAHRRTGARQADRGHRRDARRERPLPVCGS